jgi:hypothetical protein
MSLETIIKKYGAENISFALLKRANHENAFENILEHNLDSYFHPASLLKLFVSLMASELSPQNNQLEVKETEYELNRAIHESISASDNDALAFLVDYLAAYPWDYNLINIENTLKFTPDEQSQDILNKILNSRLQINKFFLEKGFSEKINLVNKCFGFDYYGKEKQIYEALGHNQINNRDLIKLLILIEKDFPLILNSMQRVLENNEDYENAEVCTERQSDVGRVAERTSSRLRRTNDRSVLPVHEDHEDDENAEIGVPLHAHDIPSGIINTEDYQVQAFSGKVLADEFKVKSIYSKAGWNSKVRHDAVLFSINAEIGVCEQSQYILTILTKNLSHDEEILQEIAREVLLTLTSLPESP